MNRTVLAAWIAGLCCALPACSTRTDVSVTGNTPAQYSHVWITAQEVWFHTSATAGPDDGGWVKFRLSTPATVDLVTESGGNLGNLITGLNLAPGTYSQARLIPVDPSASLARSAQSAGALYNAEADYVDSAGTTHQLPLELLNPDKGVGIQTSLKVPLGKLGTGLAAVTNNSTTGTTGSTTGTTGTTPTPTTTTSTTTRTSFAVNFDGTRDLSLFTYAGGTRAVLLNSHATGFDLSSSGGIEGHLTLTNLNLTAVPDIQVSAETLSADGTRHAVVNSTAVHSDGSFLLYPLATSASNPTDYDLVIHDPAIATIIIKAVQVTAPGSSSSASTTTTVTSATSTVSVGTLIPRAATSYTANLPTPPAIALPAGALIAFYQTLAAASEVPYVIEASPIDPFNVVLANDQALSRETLDSGTYTASGATITVVSAAPAEGAGRYLVAASAPAFADGALTSSVTAPPAGTTTPVTFSVPAPTLPSGTSSGSISAAITQATSGKYDHGELLVTHDGELVARAALDSAFAQGAGGTVTVNGIPSGTSAAVYYLAVRAWNSRDASGTLQRQWYPAVLDLRSGLTGSVQLTIN
jgi:hypothetical protein